MSLNEPRACKDALRARFRAYRAGLSKDTYLRKSAAIVERLQALPELEHAQTVHVYWPLIERHEVDVRPLADALYAEGRQVVLPVVTRYAPPPAMRHVPYRGRAALRPNRWGIHEPTGGEIVPPEALDAVVVPALGAGRNGHRIGHGFGYYDAFLGALSIPLLCPVYQACLVERVPAEAHDVPMTAIVTEKAVVRPGS